MEDFVVLELRLVWWKKLVSNYFSFVYWAFPLRKIQTLRILPQCLKSCTSHCCMSKNILPTICKTNYSFHLNCFYGSLIWCIRILVFFTMSFTEKGICIQQAMNERKTYHVSQKIYNKNEKSNKMLKKTLRYMVNIYQTLLLIFHLTEYFK